MWLKKKKQLKILIRFHSANKIDNYNRGMEKKKGYEKIFEEIIVENFPSMEKEIVKQVQEIQSPIQDKPKKKHTKTHTNQAKRDQSWRKNIKSIKGKATINIQGKSHIFNSWSFSRNSVGQKGMAGYI